MPTSAVRVWCVHACAITVRVWRVCMCVSGVVCVWCIICVCVWCACALPLSWSGVIVVLCQSSAMSPPSAVFSFVWPQVVETTKDCRLFSAPNNRGIVKVPHRRWERDVMALWGQIQKYATHTLTQTHTLTHTHPPAPQTERMVLWGQIIIICGSSVLSLFFHSLLIFTLDPLGLSVSACVCVCACVRVCVGFVPTVLPYLSWNYCQGAAACQLQVSQGKKGREQLRVRFPFTSMYLCVSSFFCSGLFQVFSLLCM